MAASLDVDGLSATQYGGVSIVYQMPDGSMGHGNRVNAFNSPCWRHIRGRLMAETASLTIVGDASL